MPEALPGELVLVVPTDLVYVRPVRKIIEGLLLSQGWGEDDAGDVGLVVTEMVQNAIEHGSRADGRERVDLRCRLNEDSVILEASDPGTGKDPQLLLARDVTSSVPLDDPRGRGLYLIHRLAAEFDRSLRRAGGCLVRVRMECDTP